MKSQSLVFLHLNTKKVYYILYNSNLSPLTIIITLKIYSISVTHTKKSTLLKRLLNTSRGFYLKRACFVFLK